MYIRHPKPFLEDIDEEEEDKKKMMMMNSESFASLGSKMASMMFIFAVCKQYFPYQLHNLFSKYTTKLISYFYPYIQISFPEYMGDRLR